MTEPPVLDDRTGPVAPTAAAERITNLDAVRGVAVLGILLMNAVSFGLGSGVYVNLDAGGSSTALDWLIGDFGEIFVDQKFMALFSMLFGAGIVLFADRAEAKGRRAGRLSLWRNTLLLAIGLVHGALWDGDVLVVYALCAPLLILARGLLGLITLWNRRGETSLLLRSRAVGRMALTNYLTQTIVGLLVLDVAFGSTEPTRTVILAVVAGIWALQLRWSTAWLERFRYGPAEWAWRCATYRRVTPLRR